MSGDRSARVVPGILFEPQAPRAFRGSEPFLTKGALSTYNVLKLLIFCVGCMTKSVNTGHGRRPGGRYAPVVPGIGGASQMLGTVV